MRQKQQILKSVIKSNCEQLKTVYLQMNSTVITWQGAGPIILQMFNINWFFS